MAKKVLKTAAARGLSNLHNEIRAKQASLLPFAFAMGQAMATVAIDAMFFFDRISEKRFVLLSVDFILRVTAHAERINLRPTIHNTRRRAVTAPGPGFIGNVGVTVAVAVRATDVGPRMDNGDILLHVVHVANEAATVIGSGSSRQVNIRVVIKQQQRFIIKQQWLIIRYGFGADLGFCAGLRLLFNLYLLTADFSDGRCRQNKRQEKISHTFYRRF